MNIKKILGASLAVALFAFVLAQPGFAATDDPLAGLGLEVDPYTSNCFVVHDSTGCDDAACEAIVVGMDGWCGSVFWDSICVQEAWDYCDLTVEGSETAMFQVNKTFADGNTEPVSVTMTCTGGLPLEQSFEISEDRNVTFVLTDYQAGQPDCVIVEDTPPGYEAWYEGGDNGPNAEGCAYEDLDHGERHTCNITNTPVPVSVTIEATWPPTGVDNDLPQTADVYLDCFNAMGGHVYWDWTIEGDDTLEADVMPVANGSTYCQVSYEPGISAVEVSGCEEQIPVNIGDTGLGCTLEFSAFFEGVPALGRHGLAVLVLLVLGVGFVGFRRFV